MPSMLRKVNRKRAEVEAASPHDAPITQSAPQSPFSHTSDADAASMRARSRTLKKPLGANT